jgi:hypothetical protein
VRLLAGSPLPRQKPFIKLSCLIKNRERYVHYTWKL